jgi:hypothetical protein
MKQSSVLHSSNQPGTAGDSFSGSLMFVSPFMSKGNNGANVLMEGAL